MDILFSSIIDCGVCKAFLREVKIYLEQHSSVVIDGLDPELPGGFAYGNYGLRDCSVQIGARDYRFLGTYPRTYLAELSVVTDGTNPKLNTDLHQMLAKYVDARLLRV